MATQGNQQLQHLENAFQAFNQMSAQLMDSYHQLEAQVERLNQELSSAQGERLQHSEQKKHLANRLERLLDALPAGVVVLDGRGFVQQGNAAAIALLGEPLKGMAWRDVIRRAFAPRADDGHDVSLQDGRRVGISTSSLGCEPGQIILITDVTEKRQLQDKLGRYQRLSAMGQMAASLAHQIRTPTASALLYLANLRHHQHDPARVEKYSEKVRQQLQHIEAMVSDMLVYARGGDSRESIFTLQGVLESLRQTVQGQIEQKGYSLDIHNQVATARLQGNREALLGALLNLVMNAIQAAGCVPLKIVLRIAAQGANRISISVEDNGAGIPDAIKASVFDPFVTTRPQGTGLGLAVVKSVIEKHGGEVTLTSKEGSGTKISILLPVLDDTSGRASEEEAQNEVWL